MAKYKYSNLLLEMNNYDESASDLSKILKVSVPTVIRKLTGSTEWTISDIETLCKHYKKDYYELFKH